MSSEQNRTSAAAVAEPAKDPFVDYYDRQSLSEATHAHFTQLRDLLLRAWQSGPGKAPPKVADIGCGAGTFSRLWAERGCEVSGIDVNQRLISIARERNVSNSKVRFEVGSASALPWEDKSFDVVVLPELLEHVTEWRACLSEGARVLRKGGLLYLSTTNVLCPVQQEFTLPLYSWYPDRLKRRCVELTKSTHPEWVNHAEYPAVNWFSPYSLAAQLRPFDMEVMDRFDVLASYAPEGKKRAIGRLLASISPLTFLGHLFTPYTVLLARKR